MYFDIGRLTQLSVESALALFSVAGGLIMIGISVARAVVTRNIATRRRKLLGKFDRTKGGYEPPYPV